MVNEGAEKLSWDPIKGHSHFPPEGRTVKDVA